MAIELDTGVKLESLGWTIGKSDIAEVALTVLADSVCVALVVDNGVEERSVV